MKVPIIDDCKMSGLNLAFQRTFGVKLMDIDVLAATAATMAKAIREGELDGASVHPEAKKLWSGGTLDLSPAYKQKILRAEVCHLMASGRATGRTSFRLGPRLRSFLSYGYQGPSTICKMCSFLSAITTVFFEKYPMMTTEAGSDVLKMAVSSVFAC